MGGGIAAQLANAGWQVKLLDVPGPYPNDSATRSAAANAGLERVARARPPLLFLPEYAEQIQTGNTADHMDCLRDADWIVEAVAERMDVKQAVMAQIEANAGPRTVVTSNTSGLSLRKMTEGRSAGFRARFLGSHFLNPPRYLKLLEVVPLSETDPEIAEGFIRFAEQILGHRVVMAKDTPGFISTRLWIQHLAASIRIAIEQGLTVEEADYLTGALLGRPRSATFRMADIVGLDIVAAIAANQAATLPDDLFRGDLQLPDVVRGLIADGRLGDKAGGGFYRREGKEIRALDLMGGTYRPRQEVRIEAVEALLKRPLVERLAVITGERSADWARFVNAILDSLTNYVEYAAPLIASDARSVDNVMKWGFQWELGPFEMEDARTGEHRSYNGVGPNRETRVFGISELQPIPLHPEYLSLADRKAAGKTVFETPDGALVDLDDGVACLEFRTKMNTVSPALCEVIVRARETAERDFAALVIGSDAPYFSAGYNLKLLVEAAVAEDWSSIDAMLRQVQSAFLGLKFSTVPVVAAVRGYTLGAGCECALHCAAIQSCPELAMGLPELSAGLVPGGGGVTELLARARGDWDGAGDPMPAIERAFRQIVLEPNSGSAVEARKLGLLRAADSISRNADRQLYDAKQKALALASAGYRAPKRSGIQVFGIRVLEEVRGVIAELLASGAFSEHDALIADRVALILSGGEGAAEVELSEEQLLALEREALIALAHEPKTIARMKALLETGKPLRN